MKKSDIIFVNVFNFNLFLLNLIICYPQLIMLNTASVMCALSIAPMKMKIEITIFKSTISDLQMGDDDDNRSSGIHYKP